MLTLLMVLVSVGGYLYYVDKSGRLNIYCQANMYMLLGENGHEPRIDSIIVHNVKPDGNGVYKLNGDFYFKGDRYKISRTVEYSYVYVDDNVYSYTVNSITLSNRDNLPNALQEAYLYDNKINQSRLVSLSKFSNNAYIINDIQSPYAVCMELDRK